MCSPKLGAIPSTFTGGSREADRVTDNFDGAYRRMVDDRNIVICKGLLVIGQFHRCENRRIGKAAALLVEDLDPFGSCFLLEGLFDENCQLFVVLPSLCRIEELLVLLDIGYLEGIAGNYARTCPTAVPTSGSRARQHIRSDLAIGFLRPLLEGLGICFPRIRAVLILYA